MIEYKEYPHTCSSATGTITAVIRQYNHMNMNEDVLQLLVIAFNDINEDILPPKMGQEVMIPVLLPFCEKHDEGRQADSVPTSVKTLTFAGPLNF